jgi:hypothetical protein
MKTLEEFLKLVEDKNLDYEIQRQEDEYGHWVEDSWTSLEDAWDDDYLRVIIVL